MIDRHRESCWGARFFQWEYFIMAAITSEDLARSIRIYETLFQATAVRGDAQCDRVLYSRLTRAIFTGIA